MNKEILINTGLFEHWPCNPGWIRIPDTNVLFYIDSINRTEHPSKWYIVSSERLREIELSSGVALNSISNLIKIEDLNGEYKLDPIEGKQCAYATNFFGTGLTSLPEYLQTSLLFNINLLR